MFVIAVNLLVGTVILLPEYTAVPFTKRKLERTPENCKPGLCPADPSAPALESKAKSPKRMFAAVATVVLFV